MHCPLSKVIMDACVVARYQCDCGDWSDGLCDECQDWKELEYQLRSRKAQVALTPVPPAPIPTDATKAAAERFQKSLDNEIKAVNDEINQQVCKAIIEAKKYGEHINIAPNWVGPHVYPETNPWKCSHCHPNKRYLSATTSQDEYRPIEKPASGVQYAPISSTEYPLQFTNDFHS